jgi:hypothetical protein
MVDNGTTCLACTPQPGALRQGSGGADIVELDKALAALQSQAQNFAWNFIKDAKARASYVSRIAEMAEQIRRDVRAGRLSAREGAQFANHARNVIMDETRAVSSAIGRAKAVAAKPAWLSLDEAIDKAVKELFPGKRFAELDAASRRKVFEEVIEASGRSRPSFTNRIPHLKRLGRGLVVVTVAISIYNIWEAENKIRQSAKEGMTMGGGALGGALATASAGFVCGPGAPACVTVLFVVGGIAGALAASYAADVVLDQQAVVGWLGE